MKLTINGDSYEADVEPEMPLLWAIRDEVGLTGTKFGCGIGMCGACSIHLDGQLVRSCILPASSAEGRKVTTIEGLSGKGAELQRAWISVQVPQCGYCQSGMLMAATDLLTRTPHPDDAAIDAAMTNICRCGTYARIKEAIHLVANGKESSPVDKKSQRKRTEG
ncbi:2Fe-2S iron-sulfur cluster binding domain-containing protein [Paraburkholderia sp. 1N]|uniref:2Fe-2S iron-sulfur cluster binding domain-containing protein n=1 Tax=Paraburkholderia solitsugae TaxID=2675748 RepID=A0ABX2BSS0_9BURK|nr:(2Fe-2S)-binding protein [Paraburkholderia solitsugae]NPT43060.1 2Fe-2S iron-sulfur cluster binding domain-containing protein [Paraburkholderia solitsugae]